jgi:hypothetical protein
MLDELLDLLDADELIEFRNHFKLMLSVLERAKARRSEASD